MQKCLHMYGLTKTVTITPGVRSPKTRLEPALHRTRHPPCQPLSAASPERRLHLPPPLSVQQTPATNIYLTKTRLWINLKNGR